MYAQAIGYYNHHKHVIVFPQEFQHNLEEAVEADAPQYGKINVVYMRHKNGNVQLKNRYENGVIDYICPTVTFPFDPVIFGE